MFVKHFIIAFILLVIIDFFYLKFSSSELFATIRSISGENPTKRYYSGILVYILLALGITLLLNPKNRKDALIKGAIFGLVTYGVFDFTTHFMFRNWDLKTSVRDVTWGTILCATVALLSKNDLF